MQLAETELHAAIGPISDRISTSNSELQKKYNQTFSCLF